MHELPSKSPKFPLLRFLLGSFWFRICLAVSVVVPLLGLGAMARIWRTSPRGFEPVVKISLVHWVQAKALRHSALKAEKRNQPDRAIYSWRLAFAHNSADPRLSRGLLQCILANSNKADKASLALQQCIWLLRLTSTNLTDLELVTKILQAYKLDALTVALLNPHENALSPPMAAAYLKALFRTGAADDFKRFHVKSAGGNSDPELSLYHAAYQAGWATEAAARSGWQQLETALQGSDQKLLATQLNMAASFARRDVARFEKAFGVATNLHSDRMVDHINRWRLYLAVTNQARARQLAEEFGQPPADAQETLALAQSFLAIDLRDKAHRLLSEFVPKFGETGDLWLFYAGLLTADQQWDRLSTLAAQMRQDRRVARQLAGQSYFLEGCAEMGRHHRAQAEAAFKKVTDYDLPTPGAVLAMAKSMVGLGFSDSAQRLLVRKQELFRKEPGYWQLLYSAAIGCKDEDTLLLAARELHALASTNWHAKYAYAAALLTLRVQPDEAVKLTRELLDQQPEHAGAKINHCFALIQNNRPQQAQAMLETIDRTEFGVLQSNAFSQLEFELYCSLGDLRHAREVSYRVDTNLLFRSEARWFEDALRRITPPKRTAAEG